MNWYPDVYIVINLVLVIVVGGGMLWCCLSLKYKTAYLEAKLKALYEHYGIFYAAVVALLEKCCKDHIDPGDPEWPPPKPPTWP